MKKKKKKKLGKYFEGCGQEMYVLSLFLYLVVYVIQFQMFKT